MIVIGECMLELIRAADQWRLGYAGDTFNTAVYLSRLGVPTAFMTALGTDPFSEELRAEWQADGLDISLVGSSSIDVPNLVGKVQTQNAHNPEMTRSGD